MDRLAIMSASWDIIKLTLIARVCECYEVIMISRIRFNWFATKKFPPLDNWDIWMFTLFFFFLSFFLFKQTMYNIECICAITKYHKHCTKLASKSCRTWWHSRTSDFLVNGDLQLKEQTVPPSCMQNHDTYWMRKAKNELRRSKCLKPILVVLARATKCHETTLEF